MGSWATSGGAGIAATRRGPELGDDQGGAGLKFDAVRRCCPPAEPSRALARVRVVAELAEPRLFIVRLPAGLARRSEHVGSCPAAAKASASRSLSRIKRAMRCCPTSGRAARRACEDCPSAHRSPRGWRESPPASAHWPACMRRARTHVDVVKAWAGVGSGARSRDKSVSGRPAGRPRHVPKLGLPKPAEPAAFTCPDSESAGRAGS